MKTRLEAKAFVYREITAKSLRQHAAFLTPTALKRDLTPAQVERVKKEMLALAEFLERKAEKMEKHITAGVGDVDPRAAKFSERR